MLFLASLLCLAAAVSHASPLAEEPATFSNKVVFVPPHNYTDPGVLYARTVELSDGTLLATWENYSPEPPAVYYPIFQSKDSGLSWKLISKVTDQVNGWGMRYQPFLYELPEDFGGFEAGTVLCAGNSIPTDLNYTKIDVYASRDKGYTWEFVSHVAAGGEALPDNGLTPVWEPFIMLYKSQIIIYYSDQRDPAHGQKLSHQTSTDLRTWGPPVDDVAYAAYTARPGMTTVTLLPNGKYMMTYEYGGGPGFASYSFPVYYRIADDPRAFNSSPGQALVAAVPGSSGGSKITPMSSPYITWSPVGGGPNGTVVVSDGTHQQVFTNDALGDPGRWVARAVPQPVAYTRHLRVFRRAADRLLIMGAGHLPPSTTNNVSLSVIDLAKTIGCR